MAPPVVLGELLDAVNDSPTMKYAAIGAAVAGGGYLVMKMSWQGGCRRDKHSPDVESMRAFTGGHAGVINVPYVGLWGSVVVGHHESTCASA
jgi:hypothetical protein